MTILTSDVEFTRLASAEQITKTVQALETNGIHTLVVETGEEARPLVISMIPPGAEVYTPPSRTVEQIGLAEEIDTSPNFRSLRARLNPSKRTRQMGEYRKLVAGPDVVVGSVHAITEKGEVLIGSATGSQLSSAAFGADSVIWLAGTQKLVPTLEDGFRRIREYSYPLENTRALQAYGRPSAINKILVVNGEFPGRITMILVKQNLGF